MSAQKKATAPKTKPTPDSPTRLAGAVAGAAKKSAAKGPTITLGPDPSATTARNLAHDTLKLSRSLTEAVRALILDPAEDRARGTLTTLSVIAQEYGELLEHAAAELAGIPPSLVDGILPEEPKADELPHKTFACDWQRAWLNRLPFPPLPGPSEPEHAPTVELWDALGRMRSVVATEIASPELTARCEAIAIVLGARLSRAASAVAYPILGVLEHGDPDSARLAGAAFGALDVETQEVIREVITSALFDQDVSDVRGWLSSKWAEQAKAGKGK